MLNRNVLREAPDVVRRTLERRGATGRLSEVDRWLELDVRVRTLTARTHELRHEVKVASASIGQAMKAGGDAEAAR